MKKVRLIVNPSAGGEKAKEYAALAEKKLTTLFDEVEINYTQKSGDAKKFAQEAAKQQYDSIFVMGGDGTVNEGISGIAEQEYQPNFGFFPLGTVNDLARALHLPLDPVQAIEQLDILKKEAIDIGKINQNYFMNVVAIGTIPESINNVDPKQKTKLGKFAYFFSGIKHLAKAKTYKFQVVLDGEKRMIESSTLLIGLTNSIGGFETLFPAAKPSDGKLHFVYLKDQNLLDSLKAIPDLLKGIEASTKNVEYVTFHQGAIKLVEGQLSTNVDGDEGDVLPIEVKILPRHITVYHRKK